MAQAYASSHRTHVPSFEEWQAKKRRSGHTAEAVLPTKSDQLCLAEETAHLLTKRMLEERENKMYPSSDRRICEWAEEQTALAHHSYSTLEDQVDGLERKIEQLITTQKILCRELRQVTALLGSLMQHDFNDTDTMMPTPLTTPTRKPRYT